MSYIDTVVLQQKTYWGRVLPYMKQHCGYIIPKEVPTDDYRVEQQLWLHQPDREAVEFLQDKECRVVQCHVALDLITSSEAAAAELHDYMERTLLRSLQPHGRIQHGYPTSEKEALRIAEGRSAPINAYSSYWYRPKSRPGTTLVVYSDKETKAAPGHACCHIEARISGKQALQKGKVRTASELLLLDHTSFWTQRLILRDIPTAEAVGERWKKGFMATRDQRASNMWPWGEANAAKRVGGLLSRIGTEHDAPKANDLLYYLRNTRYLGMRASASLFPVLDTTWMLPGDSRNGLWQSEAQQ